MAEPAGSGLTWPDFAVLAASLAALIAIGGALSREQSGTSDFFLARRRIPWWAACLSFLATEISAVTIISVPATAYRENWEYVQFFIGSSLAKFAAALAVSILMNWSFLSTLAMFTVVSIVYIALGGVSAVVWTNVFQASLFLLGGFVTVLFLVSQVDGG